MVDVFDASQYHPHRHEPVGTARPPRGWHAVRANLPAAEAALRAQGATALAGARDTGAGNEGDQCPHPRACAEADQPI